MNKYLKHKLFLLCILIFTTQALHQFSHVLISHSENDKELVHFIDNHKCSICHLNVTPLLPQNNYSIHTWATPVIEYIVIPHTNKSIKPIDLQNISLRGPPLFDRI